MKYHTFMGVLIAIVSLSVFADGNTTNQSFSKAKKMLMRDVYTQSTQRRTIYCNAAFDSKKISPCPLASIPISM